MKGVLAMSVKEAGKHLVVISAVLLLTCAALMAQDNWNGKLGEDRGPTASELFSASSTSVSGMMMFDTAVGWNFSKNFGFDAGVPYLFDTRPGVFASTSGRIGYVNYPYVGCTYFFGCYVGIETSSRMWAGELGDVYADVHYTRPYHRYNFATVLTGDAPTASFRKGLTTGRAQFDWFNHIDTDLHGFTPFLNIGLANGRMDQHFLPRPFNTDLPFRTLGYMADFEGGVEYKFWRHFTFGGSAWDVLPWGTQKIYSNIVWQTPTLYVPTAAPTGPGSFGYVAGDPNHGRYWNSAFETTGPASIARDNGYSATLAVSVFKNVDVQVAYNYSQRYQLDGVVLTVGFNANSLFRKLTNY
jgi:hypothetical protein